MNTNTTVSTAAVTALVAEIYKLYLVKEAKSLGLNVTVLTPTAAIEARIGSAEYLRIGSGAGTRARLDSEKERIRREVIRFINR